MGNHARDSAGLGCYPNRKGVIEVPAEVTLPSLRVENGRNGWAGVVVCNITHADRCARSVAVDAQERQSLNALESRKKHDAGAMAMPERQRPNVLV